MKKISLLLSLTLLLQCLSGLCFNTAGAKAVSFPISYNFESGTDGWTVRNSDNSSLSIETEGNNKFLRLKALKNKDYAKDAALSAIPSASVVFSNEFALPQSGTATISADIRTDNYADFEKLFMINRSKLATTDVQYHPATLWGWTGANKVNTYNEEGTRQLADSDKYFRAKTTAAVTDTAKLENDKWYKFVIELTTDAQSKPSALKLTVFDGATAIYTGTSLSITNKTLTEYDVIAGIDIAMAVKTISLTADRTLDIDNVSVSAGGVGKYWDLGSSLVLKKEIRVLFSETIDSSLLGSKVTLHDSDGNVVLYDGSYNADKLEYVMIPKSDIPSGNYTVKIDKTALGLADDAASEKTVTVFLSTLPEVGTCTASGRLENGKSLTASAQYVQADNISGNCKIQWQYATSANGEFTDIARATDNIFVMTGAYTDKYIRFAATPVTNSGVAGTVKYSNVLAPLQAPTAENVKIQGEALVGMEVAVTYTFKDANGDAEDKKKTQYAWYISDNGSTGWTSLSCKSKYLTIDNSMVGKYLRAEVIPASTDDPQTTTAYKSAGTFGPIAAAGSDNLVSNSGFEDGKVTGWSVRNTGTDSASITATQEDAHTGSWCGKYTGQTKTTTFLRYGVDMKANTGYIIKAAMKLADDNADDTVSVDLYDTNERGTTSSKKTLTTSSTINKTEWTELYYFVYMESGGSGISFMPQKWSESFYSVYIDDYYVAPLLVKDIELKAPESVTIPQSGKTTATLEAYGVKNQFGNSYGVENETVYWTIEDDVKGVSVENSTLYVSDEATAGTVTVKAVCEPSFDGATQERFSKSVEITLSAHDDKAPKIKNILLKGETGLNSVLNLSYDFYQIEGLSDASTVEWYVSDTENGSFTKINNVSGKSFSVTSEYVGKFIRATVSPADSNGGTGTKTESNICGPARVPEAKEVSVTGKTYNGQTLTGSYKFYDFNGDDEGATQLKWYRATSQNGTYTEISGAVGNTYVINDDDIDSWICFGVTPVSMREPNDNKIYYSSPIQGPVAPTAKDVSISKSGMVLTGKYTYESVNGAPEGDTRCEWYIDGNKVASGNQYTLSNSTNGSIEFRVTPVAKTAPYSGASVSATYTVKYNEPSGIIGGGGGATTVMPTLPSDNTSKDDTSSTPTPTPNTGKFKDIPERMEWARESIEKLAEMGIISGKEEDIFAPEDNVTRAEFLRLLLSTLNISAEDAVCDFTDVVSGAWYYNAVATAYQKGIVTGYADGSFGVNDPITRQDAAVMIVNALKAANIEIGETKEFSEFSDWKDVSQYAQSAAETLVKAGILSGSGEMFLPQDYCTRAQAAVMMYQLIVVCGLNR